MIAKMWDLVFGCRHRRITRPITPVHKSDTEAGGTYVACLECGKRFSYDTRNMRVGSPMPLAVVTHQSGSRQFQSQY
jgi:hypothetical protein